MSEWETVPRGMTVTLLVVIAVLVLAIAALCLWWPR